MITFENLIFLVSGFIAGVIISILLQKFFFFLFSGKIKQISENALSSNSNRFFDLADRYFRRFADDAKNGFNKSIDPVKDALGKYEKSLWEMEGDRQKAFGSISEQLIEMARTQQNLQLQTGNLVKALRVPHVRGRWGEMTLRRVVELSGMAEHCDFEEQVVTNTENGQLRPDMVIRLPNRRNIIVDSKVGLEAYLNALEAGSEEERKKYMANHASQVLKHVSALASKEYHKHFSYTPEFTILFIPGENFFSAALTYKPDLVETGIKNGVIIATPTTLVALLKAVAFSWRQEKSHENAEEIRRLGVELYQRLGAMAGNINRLGKDIEKCAATFNKTIGSIESRVMVSAKKFDSFGITSETIENLESIESSKTVTRQIKQERTDE
ncbi:MAG: DNA recombination protein RmuC [Desulfobacteraceae bacterium]|nr:DNA recombination protein RmuC [Desulfobacteraceae bacterium]